MRRRWIAMGLVLCLFSGLAMPVSAAEAALTVEIETVIPPAYQAAEAFRDGYAAVKLNGSWGAIDESGQMVIAARYDWLGDVSEGVAVAGMAAKGGYYQLYLVGVDGREVKLRYTRVTGGAAETADLLVSRETMEAARPYWLCQDGVAVVNGVAYLPDGSELRARDMDWAFGFQYNDCYATGPCAAGVIPMMAVSTSGDEVPFLMDKSGTILRVFRSNETITSISAPQGEYVVVYTKQGGDERCGVMNLSGEWVISPLYEDYRWEPDGTYFCDGLWVVWRDGKCGAVDVSGKTVIPFSYDDIRAFREGMAPLKQDGTYMYTDTAGQLYHVAGIASGMVQITAASRVSGGMAAVYDAASGRAYLVSTTAKNGVLPVVAGSDQLPLTVYFPDFTEGSALGSIRDTEELLGVFPLNSDGKWGYARLNFPEEAPEAIENPFTDVSADAFYLEPVLWAVGKGVTTGTTATTFSPNETCTRGQIITFLWRSAGSPEPGEVRAPFTDLTEGEFYHKAVLWAYRCGIVEAADSFGPHVPCTRAETVLYMWRYAGYMWRYGDTAGGAAVSFTDVPADAVYADAVAWAVAHGITTGTSATTFSPDATCLRGQIVTFLRRLWQTFG